MTSHPSERKYMLYAATVFTRVAVGAGFLSAVADRFGLWGPAGTNAVAWGSFDAFTEYVGVLAPYLPDTLLGATAWGATLAELALGLALLAGIALRWTAFASTATLFVFGISMFFFSGFETPFSASVFSAAAASLLLAVAPDGSHILRLDRLVKTRLPQRTV
ncbi:hypothetical protein [Mycolicibacterium conceptionense]|uniref:hypothetical protein n=1 Tax=Mycolicibacterium conceptionense TaxID=451644 RepID=UPI00097AE364|nr:hypothetical protein [Mycolicibacterium conceptionense]OMB77233.1 hypothetical protein A5743_20010 [Mycolicibacterium conceptionense]